MHSEPLNQFAFTNPELANLPAPAKRRVYYYDSRQNGLALCVTAQGTKTFYRIGRINGRFIRYRLGTFPDLSVGSARTLAVEVAGDVAKGLNPHAAKLTKRHQKPTREPTLADLFEHWFQTHAKPHKKTWSEDQRQFDAFLKSWRARPLSSIQKVDVQTLHARTAEKNGRYAANRLLALVRAMFNRADEIGWMGANPTRGIKKFKEQSRDRFLRPDELPRFFAAIAAETDETFRDFFQVTLFTGARRANVQAMRWEDVHLDSAVWRMPDTKSGEPVLAHLAPETIKILRRRQKAADSQWVFPSRGTTGHLVELKSAWKRIVDRAKLADLRIHDLRRTLGSWQAAGGSSLPVIGKSLGHKNQATTAIYARLTMGPVVPSVNAAVAAIAAAGKPKPKRKKATGAKRKKGTKRKAADTAKRRKPSNRNGGTHGQT